MATIVEDRSGKAKGSSICGGEGGERGWDGHRPRWRKGHWQSSSIGSCGGGGGDRLCAGIVLAADAGDCDYLTALTVVVDGPFMATNRLR